MNPYKLVKKNGLGIYDQKYVNAYSGKVCAGVIVAWQRPFVDHLDCTLLPSQLLHETPPHTFAIAEDAYAAMLRADQSQCVLITGESGAGKTEASKQIMQYLASVSTQGRDAGTWAETERVKAALLESNPLLEAFGNAKTVRNNNSSRFGKYMSLVFDYDGVVRGGHVRNYLLEKSRVTHQAGEERNFHVFYQLIAGASKGVSGVPSTSALQLLNAADYSYLSNGAVSIPGHSDSEELQEVVHAMGTLGIDVGTQGEIWRLLSALLCLGNLQFEEAGGASAGKPAGSAVTRGGASGAALASIAVLLGITEERLEKALTTRKFGQQAAAGGGGAGGRQRKASVYDILLDVAAAQFTRDSLAKASYERLFSWIVRTVNKCIAVSDTGATAGAGEGGRGIGILDIYGFEIFEVNSFEQLCINYVNEKLQQIFIDLTLKSEQEEYAKEGITWTPVEYFNNEVVCKLIEGKVGIFSLMDDKCAQKDASDEQLVGAFSTTLAPKSKQFELPKRAAATVFVVKHYAGDVQYDASGFIEKNKDTLFNDLLMLMAGSKLKLVQELFEDERSDAEKRKRPPTAGTQFKKQVQTLVDTLRSAEPHYVRCVKPNSRKLAINFEDDLTAHQVRYLGLLENIRVRRAGFVFRQTLPRFLHRYKCLSSVTYPQHPKVAAAVKGLTLPEAVTGIKGYVPSRRGIRTGAAGAAAGAGGGSTPRAGGEGAPDGALMPAFSAAVKALLTDATAVTAKDGGALKEGDGFALGKTKVFIRAPSTLFALEARRNKKVAELASQITAVVKGHQASQRYRAFRHALVCIQASARGLLAKKLYAAMRQKAVLMQAFARGMRERSKPEVIKARADLGLVKFFGKRRRRVSLQWDDATGDHCDMAGNAYLQGQIADVVKKEGGTLTPAATKVLFSDMVIKLNKSFKSQRRMLVVTGTHLLNCIDDLAKPKVQRAVPLADIQQVVMSPHSDCYVLVMCPASHDYLYIVQRKTQFTQRLREAYKSAAVDGMAGGAAGSAAAGAGGGSGGASKAANLPVVALHDAPFMNAKGGVRGGKDNRRITWMSFPAQDSRFPAHAAGKPNDAEKLVKTGLEKPAKACGGGEGAWSETPQPYHEQGAGLTLRVVVPQTMRPTLRRLLSAAEYKQLESQGVI